MTRSQLGLGMLSIWLVPFFVAADDRPRDFTELSKLLQQAAVEKCPKRFEDNSEWGRTIPFPTNVRLPRLQRKVVKVNGRDEYPDGTWKRSFVWIDEPAKDLSIQVVDVKQLEGNVSRVRLNGSIFMRVERERQQWKNGVKLLGVSVRGDARVNAEVDCDVKITIDASKFPPDVLAEPKVVGLKLELKQFDIKSVGRVIVEELPRELGEELKRFLQGQLRQRENEIKVFANQALAQALKGGKARLSPADLLKLKAPAKADK